MSYFYIIKDRVKTPTIMKVPAANVEKTREGGGYYQGTWYPGADLYTTHVAAESVLTQRLEEAVSKAKQRLQNTEDKLKRWNANKGKK